MRTYQNVGRQNSRQECRGSIGMKIIAEKEVEVGLEKDHFRGILIIEGTIEV